MFSIASFGWTISDLDGLGNISRTEIAINDTTNEWIEIPIPQNENRLFISLEFDNTTLGTVDANVFQGRSFSTLQGFNNLRIKINENNTFYVRTIDNAGAVSPIDSVTHGLSKSTSKTLFINDFSGSFATGSSHSFHKGQELIVVSNQISG